MVTEINSAGMMIHEAHLTNLSNICIVFFRDFLPKKSTLPRPTNQENSETSQF